MLTEKVKAWGVFMISLAMVVVSHSISEGKVNLREIDWGSLALLGSMLAVSLAALTRGVPDAHRHDKNGGTPS